MADYCGLQNGNDRARLENLAHFELRAKLDYGGSNAQFEFWLAAWQERIALEVMTVGVFDFQNAHGSARTVGLANLKRGLIDHRGIRPDI